MTKRVNLRSRIESMVHAILDDVNDKHPNTMDELMQKNEFSNSKTLPLAITENVSGSLKRIKTETTAFELLRASLGLIFWKRYGWTEETIDGMTLPEVFIALEHAMEYDASNKSVWDL